ncbi:MAG TPA: PQQ-binding-like beta-propeller repeat protein, partial [Planctomycetia bacterium]|nr:PQQ-binding-like beta-propeller repeat protein [Planctomycetia bacterium]
MINRLFCAGACWLLLVSPVAAADWRQFRGNDQSSAAAAALPTKFSAEENLAWKTALSGRGVSGPIVVGDKVILTSSRGHRDDRLAVTAYSTADGKKAWDRQFRCTGSTGCHPKMCMATPTPASDGKHIVAFYSCNDVACLDLDGNVLWFRGLTHDYPNASNTVGMSSSPLIVGDVVVVQVENQADSFAAGLDMKTGANRWKIKRTEGPSWSSPTLLKGKNGKPDLVLLQSSDRLSAVDPATGKAAWEWKTPVNIIPSVT